MKPSIVILSAWMLFGGSHLVLSLPAIRDRLASRLGRQKFTLLYTLFAALSLGALGVATAIYGKRGPAGLDLAANDILKWFLGAIAFFGAGLTVAGFLYYPKSAIAALARRGRAVPATDNTPLPAPTFVHRLTRHPFFVGIAILMGAHALLASTQVMAIFFGGFCVLAILGIPMLDHKMLSRHGSVYADYQARTSVLPFSISTGPDVASSKSASDEKATFKTFLITAFITFVVLALHPLWRVGNGIVFVMLINLGGLYAVFRQFQRARLESLSC